MQERSLIFMPLCHKWFFKHNDTDTHMNQIIVRGFFCHPMISNEFIYFDNLFLNAVTTHISREVLLSHSSAPTRHLILFVILSILCHFPVLQRGKILQSFKLCASALICSQISYPPFPQNEGRKECVAVNFTKYVHILYIHSNKLLQHSPHAKRLIISCVQTYSFGRAQRQVEQCVTQVQNESIKM